MEKDFLAHVKRNQKGNWEVHHLDEHLREVARRASEMGAGFNSGDWANLAGLWHDLGKYRNAFQGYIKKKSGYDPDAHIEQGRVDHSTAGAIYATEQIKGAGQFLAYLIAGHHAGLPDWVTADSGGSALSVRLQEGKQKGYLSEALRAGIPNDILQPNIELVRTIKDVEGLHLWLRMLFSCLVDADFLDTEMFMEPQKTKERQSNYSFSELKDKFDTYMKSKTEGADETVVNKCRATILEDCRRAGRQSPGIYTLTVPTGGGKTLSAMAFALEHIVQHQQCREHPKCRIIVAIPYTSIIEQTAKQYREIFGDAVLEHHSNLDPDKATKENARSRLSSENWDSPIVVTTNVQLFESLFAARTSRCRKLHNIANSVIIIDEAQLLPPGFMQPILDVLRLLTEQYGVTLVLSTATQPALGTVKDTFGKTVLRGLDAKLEIISDVSALFQALSRVEVTWPSDVNSRSTWEELAIEISRLPRVLAIVNSRRDARELYELMPDGAIHLSAQMCGEHRSKVIELIKQKLKSGESVRVVSTQLVEAGVDMDFPVVYRALAGLDSITQAAGRCNREGKLKSSSGEEIKGRVVVFVPPRSPAKGLLLYGEQATKSVLHGLDGDVLSHTMFEAYFQQYFSQESPDKHNIMPLLVREARQGIVQFKSTEQRFRLIDDSGQNVLVPYGADGFKLLDTLRNIGPERYLMRKLQRFTVNVYDYEFERLKEIGAIEDIHSGIWGLCVSNGYDEILGLLHTDNLFSDQPGNYVISGE